MTEPVWVRFCVGVASMARAMPKSVTFTWPSRVISTLPGLTSRCTTPLRWANAERGGDVGGDLGGPVGVQRALGRGGSRRRRPALDVLHDDEVRAVLLAPVVDADDVGVVEVGGGLRLAPEPLDERRVGGELGEQHLDRDRPVEQLVAAPGTPRPSRPGRAGGGARTGR